MVSEVGPRKTQHRGGEEHGLIVGVGNEEDDGFVAEGGDAGLDGVGGVEPGGEENYWDCKAHM